MHLLKKILIILSVFLVFCMAPKKSCSQEINLKKYFKFATFYGAVNGGTSISDIETFSVSQGLTTTTVKTPYDYNIAFGVRKIARFGYENRANTFYDGTEDSWSDGANVGKISGLEFLFELDKKRQEGIEYLDQHHFVRQVDDWYILKFEYLQDGFADIEYFETSQRYRKKINNRLSYNIGASQRLSEPYGYDPLEEWYLANGGIHYTYLALQEGYNINVYEGTYYNPDGDLVANSVEVWEEVIIPNVLRDYTEKKRNELDRKIQQSLVLGFDYYYYSKKLWLHSWANIMPWHYDDGGEFMYHNYVDGQWTDYSGGIIFGLKLNRSLGTFIEGKYNKYWNREWYDFKCGINYIIF